MRKLDHLADIHIDQVENGFQVTVETPHKGRIFTGTKNKTYVAETKDKLKKVLEDIVDELELL